METRAVRLYMQFEINVRNICVAGFGYDGVGR